mgnify:CR=1 FL=1
MAQSFWLTEEWKKFKKYTEWLEKRYKTMKSDKLKESIDKWKRGFNKMSQEAVSWGIVLKMKDPEFLVIDRNDIVHTDSGITYINPKCDGIDKIGLHRGKCYWEGDTPIFNIDFFHDYIKDCDTKEEADFKLQLYIKFHGIGEA